MKKLLDIAICLCLLIGVADLAHAGAPYRGKNSPSIEVIQRNVAMYKSDIKVVGIHKQRDGAYLVITDKSSGSWGGPYELLRLESNEWVMTEPGNLYKKFVFMTE